MKIDTLREELIFAECEAVAARSRLLAAEKAYAIAKAESTGLRVGTIIFTKCKEGFPPRVKIVTRRYRVTRIAYCSYRKEELELWGTTVKKDGTDGAIHMIWEDWEIEA